MNIPIIVESANQIGNRKLKIGTLLGTGWKCTGDNPKEFREQLITRLERQEHFLNTRKYIYSGDVVFCLYYADGWCYDMVRPSNVNCPSVCLLSVKTYMEALEQVTRHAAQYAEQFNTPSKG